MTDPRDHIGLAWKMADWARRRFGGEACEYVAECWFAIERCAQTHDAEMGSFASYASALAPSAASIDSIESR